MLASNSEGLFLSSQKDNENRCHVFPSSMKREIRKVHVILGHSCTVMVKKCTKRHDVRTKLLFCLSKPIAFLPFSLLSPSPSPSSLLSLPNANNLLKTKGSHHILQELPFKSHRPPPPPTPHPIKMNGPLMGHSLLPLVRGISFRL